MEQGYYSAESRDTKAQDPAFFWSDHHKKEGVPTSRPGRRSPIHSQECLRRGICSEASPEATAAH